MKHVRTISQPLAHYPEPAQLAGAGLEAAILVLLTVFFQDYDNFPSVIQNLQKFFSKV